MAIIANRTKNKYKAVRGYSNLMLRCQRFIVLIFIIISLQLIYLSPNYKTQYWPLEICGSIMHNSLKSIYNLVNTFYDFKNFTSQLGYLQKENIELKLEIAKLQTVKNNLYITQQENHSLKTHLNVVKDFEYSFVTAPITLVSIGPYSHSLIVQAGKNNGIVAGQVVTYANKLIGRITEVSNNYSKVLLVTDVTSKIPVISANSHIHGIISGNQDGETVLMYTHNDLSLNIGEALITSGDGKYYPPGLIVATVTKIINNEVHTRPAVNLHNVDFVNIIKVL